MPRVSDTEDFIRADTVQDGDIAAILEPPVLIEAEKAHFGRACFELRIKLPNGQTKTYTPNRTTLKNLAGAWGDETDNWTGKKIRFCKVRQIVLGEQKNVLYGEPV